MTGEAIVTSSERHDGLRNTLRRRTPESGRVWQEIQRTVPGGLLSGARKFEPYPFFAERGEGPHLWDIDGNRYLDCCMAYGVLLLGHCPAPVVEAAADQLRHGSVYGTPHRLELEFTRRLVECIPCADQVLLCNSGTEATMQAIRLLRAHTGRPRIAKFEGGYHGWHDYAMWTVYAREDGRDAMDLPATVPESAGIPERIRDFVLVLPYDNRAFDLIQEHAGELAGVLIEPVVGGGTLPAERSFLERLREVTRRCAVPLMFDEVITGFRLALGGAQSLYGIMPDLATYGKIIGGGLPIGAVGVSRELAEVVVRSDLAVSVAGTFSGNPLTLAAGNAVLKVLMDRPQVYEELASNGDHLRSAFNSYAHTHHLPATMTGVGSMFQTHFKTAPVEVPMDMLGQPAKALADFQLVLRLNGVFIPWLHLAFLSAAHNEDDVEAVLRAHQVSIETCLDESSSQVGESRQATR